MYFSLYWRTILATVFLISVVAFVHQQFNVLAHVGNTNYYPALFWLLIATCFFAATFFQRNGLVFILWGNRLNLQPSFWRRFNFATGIFFVGLAILALVFYHLSGQELWSYYKLFGQPLLLIAVPALYTKKLLSDA